MRMRLADLFRYEKLLGIHRAGARRYTVVFGDFVLVGVRFPEVLIDFSFVDDSIQGIQVLLRMISRLTSLMSDETGNS